MRTLKFAASAAVLATWGAAQAQIQITVIPAVAPNAFGSPSWGTWLNNALDAIEAGAPTWGTPGTPGYYETAPGAMPTNWNFVTSFYSWKGVYNPATPYDAELGNRLHFGIHIMGNGQRFSISQLQFTAVSDDPGNSLGFGFDLGSYHYSEGYVGIDYGPDRVKGTADDLTITGGDNTQLVDELVGRGSGNAWWPLGDTPTPGNGSQQALDDFMATLPSTIRFKGTYKLIQGKGKVIAMGKATVTFVKPYGGIR